MRADNFDERLLHWIDEHRVGWVTSVSTWLLHVNESSWFWIAAGLLGLAVVIFRRAWRSGLAVTAAAYLGGTVSDLLKEVFERPRPTFPDTLVQVDGYAMPSSHASFSVAASLALLLVVQWGSRRALALVAGGLAAGLVLIGLTMTYLGAHWATDVLAGWALGIPIGLLCGLLFRKRERSA